MNYLKPFAAVFTFILGIFAAFLQMPSEFRMSTDCRSDAPYLAALPVKAPETVDLCELARDPGRYDGKIVQLRADLKMTQGEGVYAIADKACPSKWARLTCGTGSRSCSSIFDAAIPSDVSPVEFYAEGRFFASVLENPPGGAVSRVRLFEITGDVDIKTSAHVFKRRAGSGSGVGVGSGTGDGVGTGHGEGRGSGSGSGYGTGQGTGSGSGRGGGGSGGEFE